MSQLLIQSPVWSVLGHTKNTPKVLGHPALFPWFWGFHLGSAMDSLPLHTGGLSSAFPVLTGSYLTYTLDVAAPQIRAAPQPLSPASNAKHWRFPQAPISTQKSSTVPQWDLHVPQVRDWSPHTSSDDASCSPYSHPFTIPMAPPLNNTFGPISSS